ncbi:MAG: peptide chain release factor 1 [Nitrospinae bacterium]|nr:peptide chain release factor 1 [Nitrospinota bacterium]
MFDKLAALERKFEDLNLQIVDPDTLGKQELYQKKLRELSSIRESVELYQQYKKVKGSLDEAKTILKDNSDKDLIELAKEEIPELEENLAIVENNLKLSLIPKDPLDEKSVIVEIRAGTGGDEAAIFAGDLFRMYSRYAENNRWKIEVMSCNEIGVGGIKEIIMEINGKNVYSKMKFESGTHRVQRVPETESQGRIHTSAATVAVMAKPEEIDMSIDPNDLKIDIYRSSGNGGQSVNTTDSAVRITHIPTGITVSMQDEKSQHKNKAKGMEVLRARLFEKRQNEQNSEISESRRAMVGTGDRSQRIRTYNFPQGRVTDHRIGLTLYRLGSIISGDLDELMSKLQLFYQTETLKQSYIAA